MLRATNPRVEIAFNNILAVLLLTSVGDETDVERDLTSQVKKERSSSGIPKVDSRTMIVVYLDLCGKSLYSE